MSEIVLERDGGVAVITLAAPQRRNALVPMMCRELIEVCDQVDADPEVGAVVLRAHGASFCAGAHRGRGCFLGICPRGSTSPGPRLRSR